MNPDPRQPQEYSTPQQPQAPVFTDVPEPVAESFSEPVETPVSNQFNDTSVSPEPVVPSPFGPSADALAPTPLVQPTPMASPPSSATPLVTPVTQSHNKLIIILAIVGGVLILGGAAFAVFLTM